MSPELEHHLHLIEAIMNRGDLIRAMTMLEEMSKKYPENYYVTSLLGECYLTVGRPEKAIKPLQWAMKLAKKTEPPEIPKKIVNDEKDTVANLRKMFLKREKFNPWVDHYLIGCAYGRVMKLRTAIRHLTLADKLNPNDPEILRNLGWILCMGEDLEKGRVLLRKAVELDPGNALAYNDLGASYMFEENLETAKQWISKARELDPEDAFIKATEERLDEFLAYKIIQRKLPLKNNP